MTPAPAREILDLLGLATGRACRAPGFGFLPLAGAGDRTLRQGLAVAGDFAGGGDPQRLALTHDVPKSVAESPQPITAGR